MSNAEVAAEMLDALHKEYNEALNRIDELEAHRGELLERPNIPPCKCEHPWHMHCYTTNSIGPRGGCSECDCGNMVFVVRIGQGRTGTIVL